MINRRGFLKGSGVLMVGFSLCPANVVYPFTPNDKPEVKNPVDAWIRLTADGSVTVLTGKTELGQGIKTALMQIAAEELDVSMNRVKIIIAETEVTPDERYTAGSASIEGSGTSIRLAAATARAELLTRASKQLNITVKELSVKDGVITKTGSATSISYWDIVKGQQLDIEVLENTPVKNPDTYTIVGTPYPREEIKAMATAMPYYIQDLRLPGMVHARVLRPALHGAGLVTLQVKAALAMPGVLNIVKDGSFAAVVATEEYQAIKALEVLKKTAKWEDKILMPKHENIYADMLQNREKPEVVKEADNFETNYKQASIKVVSGYQRPYQMHGSIGPSCAIAQYTEGKLTVWSHTQGVYPLRKTLAHLLSIKEGDIKVYSVAGAGCYGHNGADDVAADAALLALQMPGLPVRVQWMREDEHTWEPYGPAMMHRIKAGMNKEGRITAWQTEVWSGSHSSRPGGKAGHFLAGRQLEEPFEFEGGGYSGGSHRNAEPLYDFDNKRVVLYNYKGPLRTSALRGLGAYANVFALECFMDELAHTSGQDPVAFRLKHLSDARAKEVIQLVAEKAGFGTPIPPGTGMGIAFAQYKNQAAYCAVVAKVKTNSKSEILTVEKLTAVIDAGQTINSDGLKNQTSGGMIQSASWTLLEQVHYNDNEITSTTWETYPILRFNEVPDTEVFIIDRPHSEPMGAGEAAQGPTAAAIANAVFNATGTRVTSLPLTPDKIDWKNLKQK